MTLIAHAELHEETKFTSESWQNIDGLSIWLESEVPVELEAYLGIFVQGQCEESHIAEIQIVDFTNMQALAWTRLNYPAQDENGLSLVQSPQLKVIVPPGEAKQYVVQARVFGGEHYLAPAWQPASIPSFTAVEL